MSKNRNVEPQNGKQNYVFNATVNSGNAIFQKGVVYPLSDEAVKILPAGTYELVPQEDIDASEALLLEEREKVNHNARFGLPRRPLQIADEQMGELALRPGRAKPVTEYSAEETVTSAPAAKAYTKPAGVNVSKSSEEEEDAKVDSKDAKAGTDFKSKIATK